MAQGGSRLALDVACEAWVLAGHYSTSTGLLPHGIPIARTIRRTEAISRGARMLRSALGPAIARYLKDASIVEVMLNPDCQLWIDRLSSGLTDTRESLSAADGERIVRLVAHHVGAEVHTGAPRVSAELPEIGKRLEDLLPSVVAAPAFAIRKPAVAVFTLDDYRRRHHHLGSG